MRKFKKLLKRDKGTWILAVMTLLVAGFSIWTSNYLYRTRNSEVSEDASAQTPSRCVLNFAITPPPCLSKVAVVGLSMDRSSSMNQLEADGRKKLEWAKDAAETFVSTIKNSGSTNISLSINSFGAQGTSGGSRGSSYNSILHIPTVNVSQRYNDVVSALNSVRYIQEGTCVECGIRIANTQADAVTDPTVKKVAILISDGKANRSWSGASGTEAAKANAIKAANEGRAKGVQYYVIGYGTGIQIDEPTLRSIAGSSGNYQYKPNAADWSNAFLNILTSICRPGSTVAPTRNVSPTRGVSPTRSVSPTRAATPTRGTVPTVGAGTRLTPTEDAHVRSTYPNTNYGSRANMFVDNTPKDISYIKLDTTAYATRTISKATLYLYVSNGTTGTISMKPTNAWQESAVTYNTRPTLGAVFKTFTARTSGTWVAVDVTTFVNSNKGRILGIAFETTSSDGLVFNSTEASANKPYLLIQ